MKFFKKLFWGSLLAGAGYLHFSKKGKAIKKEIQAKLPTIMKEAKSRYKAGKKTLDQVVDEVVEEWKHAKKVMGETAAPLKREVKRRMKK